MIINKNRNWRLDYDWTNPEDHPVNEATEDCKKIEEASPFTNYETNVIQLKELN